MPALADTLTSENYFASCVPAIRTDIDRKGVATLTNLQIPTPSELDAIYSGSSTLASLRVMDGLFRSRLEHNAMGYKLYDLADFLMDMSVDVSKDSGLNANLVARAEIAPFYLSKREEPINNQSWRLSSGFLSDIAAETWSTSTKYWSVKVQSDQNIPFDVDWFPVNSYVIATTTSAGSSTAITQWKVAAVLADQTAASGRAEAGHYLVLTPAMGVTPFGTFSWDNIHPSLTPPETGDLVNGANNVTPYESWCNQAPGLLNGQMDPFWIQFVQDTVEVSESYREWQKTIADKNVLYDAFYNLPEAQYRKQMADRFRKNIANQLMFGLPESANQTMELYRSLPTASFSYPATFDPSSATGSYVGTAGATEVVTRKANTVGMFWQHYSRGRVIDLQNKPFNLPAFFDVLYPLIRYRRQINMPNSNIVEAFCSSTFHSIFRSAFMTLYKDVWKDMLRFTADADKTMTAALGGLQFVEYPLPNPPGARLRLVFHEYWDDLRGRMNTAGHPTAGNQLWVLPWQYNRMGVTASIHKTREVGNIEDLAKINPYYKCQLLGRKSWITMTNLGISARCTAPTAGLIFMGLNGDSVEPLSKGTEDYVKACGSIM